MRRLIVVLWCLAAAAPEARADGAYVKEGGGVVVPRPNGDVQLVRETVDIAVSRDDLLAPDDVVTVTVTYRFRNLTDRKVDLKMGFPVGWDRMEQYMQAEGYLDRDRTCPISAFETTVDGRTVKTRLVPPEVPPLQPLDEEERIEQMGREVGEETDGEPAAEDEVGPDEFGALQYYVWPVSFAPRGERTVVNRYRYDATAGVYWEENLFRYVLRSGATWKGPIEKATIRFRFRDKGCLHEEGAGPESCCTGFEELTGFQDDPFAFSPEIPTDVTPDGATLRTAADGTTEVVWELTNFEPDADIAFGYETALAARKALRQRVAALDLAKTDRATLAQARDTLLALHGLRFEDAARRARFAARSWYVVDPKMTLARAAADPLVKKLAAALKSPPKAPPKRTNSNVR